MKNFCLALMLAALLCLGSISCIRPLAIEKVVLFPFTADNIKTPDLSGPGISSAPQGTPIAVVGRGLNFDPLEYRARFNGEDLPIWMAGGGFLATFLVSATPPQSGTLTVETPNGAVDTPFSMENPVELTTPIGAVTQGFLDVIDDRFLRAEVRARVQQDLPEAVAGLDLVRVNRDELGRVLAQSDPKEVALIDATIQATGFLAFFQQNPPLTNLPYPRIGGVLLSPLQLVEVATIVAEVGIGVAISGTTAIIVSRDQAPAVDRVTLVDRLTEGEVKENGVGIASCTAHDNGLGESGLASITIFLRGGDGNLEPPSGEAIPAQSDPFTASYLFTPNATGRSRNVSLSCRAIDGGSNRSFQMAALPVRETNQPQIVLIDTPDGVPAGTQFDVRVQVTDLPIIDGSGVPSGVDTISLTRVAPPLAALAGISRDFPGDPPGPPSHPGGSGSQTATFILGCTAEGEGAFTVSATDTAGNTADPQTRQVQCFR